MTVTPFQARRVHDFGWSAWAVEGSQPRPLPGFGLRMPRPEPTGSKSLLWSLIIGTAAVVYLLGLLGVFG